jgi:hypothetical protein
MVRVGMWVFRGAAGMDRGEKKGSLGPRPVSKSKSILPSPNYEPLRVDFVFADDFSFGRELPEMLVWPLPNAFRCTISWCRKCRTTKMAGR